MNFKEWLCKAAKPSPAKRALFFVVVDTLLLALSFDVAYQLRFNFALPPEHQIGMHRLIWIAVPLKLLFLYLFRQYAITWRYFVLSDARNLFVALLLAEASFGIGVKLLYAGAFPRTVLAIDFMLSLLMLSLFRLSKRVLADFIKPPNLNPTLLIGANAQSMQVISSARKGEIPYYPVAVVEEDESFAHAYLAGVKIYPMAQMESLIHANAIDSAIITAAHTSEELDRLFERLKSYGVRRIKHFKLLGDKHEKLQSLSIEDLLARQPKDLDTEAIASFIRGKRIMITGAGGSIGSEIARQCARYGADQLILLDHSEYNLYRIAEELEGCAPVTLMQSVVDRKLLQKSFHDYRPQIVIHAAAYKHVPLCESNVEGAVLNNIVGTINTIDLAIAYEAEKFVLISTDKAVRPTNVMGATKRVCELYAQNVPSEHTLITAVRFGNVLGSSGSVIPKFRYQIEHDQPLTVTHPEVTRYFMLIPEACQLVLQAASIAKKRELFILDMGKPVKIVDLARKMLKLYDKEHLGIVFTGLRPGEKLYEELLIDEQDRKTAYDSIMVARATRYDIEKLKRQIEALLYAEDKIEILAQIVPEFDHHINR